MTSRRPYLLPAIAGVFTTLTTGAWAHSGHLGAEVPGSGHSHAMTSGDVLLMALVLALLAVGLWFVSRRDTAAERRVVRRQRNDRFRR